MTTEVKPVIDIQRYSSFTQLVRVITLVFRVVPRSHLFSSTPLSVNELSKAKIWLFKQAQNQTFSETVEKLKKGKPLPLSNPLQSLSPFLDADGLLTVGGRLSQSHKAYHSRHSVILHGKHHLTSPIIQSEHKRLCHAGPKLTPGSLQDLYHIVSARRVVRNLNASALCVSVHPEDYYSTYGPAPSGTCTSNLFQWKGLSWLCRTFNSQSWINPNANIPQGLRSRLRLSSNWILSHWASLRPHCWSFSWCPPAFCLSKRKTIRNLEWQCNLFSPCRQRFERAVTLP